MNYIKTGIVPREKARFFYVMKNSAKKFYKSKQWQRVRSIAWTRDRGLCQDCLRRGLITPAVEVHHIKELTPDNIDDASITLNLENLVSLCKECHANRHTGNEPKRYTVSALGKVESR